METVDSDGSADRGDLHQKLACMVLRTDCVRFAVVSRRATSRLHASNAPSYQCIIPMYTRFVGEYRSFSRSLVGVRGCTVTTSSAIMPCVHVSLVDNRYRVGGRPAKYLDTTVLARLSPLSDIADRSSTAIWPVFRGSSNPKSGDTPLCTRVYQQFTYLINDGRVGSVKFDL